MSTGSGEFRKNLAAEFIKHAGIKGLGSMIPIGDTPVPSSSKTSSEYGNRDTTQILDPELSLKRLGYSAADPIDWRISSLSEKSDLYAELKKRIVHRKNTDCKVYVGGEEFDCHLIVLQCFSELFDGYNAIKKIELPTDKCSAESFGFIYDWMVRDVRSYQNLNRENILDILNAAKYLKIKDLTEQCWGFIDNSDILNEDTAFLLYADAKIKGLEEVRQLMVPRIQSFFLILVSSQDWLELEVGDVKTLLSSNYIRINSEVEVFMSAVRWLKYDWKARDQFKYEIIQCVRFGNIAAWQLIDIRRNPDNTEFVKLVQDPAIAKLIDDGLSYVVINYWYSEEKDGSQRWNTTLNLQEPQDRNWTGLDKTFFTYRDFLIYLDQNRRSELMARSKLKNGGVPPITIAPLFTPDKEVAAGPPTVDLPPEDPLSRMEEFLMQIPSPASSKKSFPKTNSR